MNIQFQSPAVYWTEALPVGNGRLGAMVFGGVEKERIALMKIRFGQVTLRIGIIRERKKFFRR